MHVQVYAHANIAQCSSQLKKKATHLLKIAAAVCTEPELPLLLTSDSSTSSSCPGRLPGLGEGSTRVVTGMGTAVDSHAGSMALHHIAACAQKALQQSRHCCRQDLLFNTE